MQAKIALLAKLAFGQDVALDKVPCAGISNLSSADFACAKVGTPTLAARAVLCFFAVPARRRACRMWNGGLFGILLQEEGITRQWGGVAHGPPLVFLVAARTS